MGFLRPPSAPAPPPPPPSPPTMASSAVALSGANERAAAAASGAMGFDNTPLSGSQGAAPPSTLGGAKSLSGA